MAAIKCESLTKTFRNVTVLHDITLDIEENTLFGVLGPDGSGKTTLLKLLTGLLKPTSGSCHLFDVDVSKSPESALQDAGCMVGDPAFYRNFTAQEILTLFADLLGVDADNDFIEPFNDVRGEHLTRGMKKQLGIALALLGNPRLLILDEPLIYLDADVRPKIIDLLKSEEKTIFFTTCNPHDIQDLAREGCLIKNGEITARGPAKKLLLDNKEVEK